MTRKVDHIKIVIQQRASYVVDRHRVFSNKLYIVAILAPMDAFLNLSVLFAQSQLIGASRISKYSQNFHAVLLSPRISKDRLRRFAFSSFSATLYGKRQLDLKYFRNF